MANEVTCWKLGSADGTQRAPTAPTPIRSAEGCHCGQGTVARSRTARLIAVQSKHMVAIRNRAV